jgi:DNA-binding sugar fermentation-stimulating protein
MIQYENTVPGIFVRRVNRFVAEVLIDGKLEQVHVKNTGRLKELLLPNARVTLQRADNPDRTTAYDLISVYKPRLKRGIGLFPDAPTERGVRHLDEPAAAAKGGYHRQIVFVIQMNGIHMVFPNDDTQPEFGQALIRAAKAGVQLC